MTTKELCERINKIRHSILHLEDQKRITFADFHRVWSALFQLENDIHDEGVIE